MRSVRLDRCAVHFDGMPPSASGVTTWMKTPERLLDAGCGKGFLGQAVSPFCGKYHGLDFSSTAVLIAKKRVQHGTFSVASICSLPYPENTFDCVLCSEVLEHVPRYQQVLSEINRVLLPGCCGFGVAIRHRFTTDQSRTADCLRPPKWPDSKWNTSNLSGFCQCGENPCHRPCAPH